MAKKRPKNAVPVVGDTFAIPLDGGRFAVCRILAVRKNGDLLVANADWIGDRAPTIDAPGLDSILRLTHHNWRSEPSLVVVEGAPPDDFILIGNIPLDPGKDARRRPGKGGWPFFRIQPQKQWLWDHAEDAPPPPPAPAGRFILHRFNGDEVYRLESAEMFVIENEEGATLWFEVKADREHAQRCEDTAESGASPSAEVGIELPDLDAGQLVGREFVIPGTQSDDEDSCMSLLCYFEHESLRDNRIKVMSRNGDRFRLRWTAVVRDVCYYDDSKPPTKVEIEGEFTFNDIGKWAGD